MLFSTLLGSGCPEVSLLIKRWVNKNNLYLRQETVKWFVHYLKARFCSVFLFFFFLSDLKHSFLVDLISVWIILRVDADNSSVVVTTFPDAIYGMMKAINVNRNTKSSYWFNKFLTSLGYNILFFLNFFATRFWNHFVDVTQNSRTIKPFFYTKNSHAHIHLESRTAVI